MVSTRWTLHGLIWLLSLLSCELVLSQCTNVTLSSTEYTYCGGSYSKAAAAARCGDMGLRLLVLNTWSEFDTWGTYLKNNKKDAVWVAASKNTHSGYKWDGTEADVNILYFDSLIQTLSCVSFEKQVLLILQTDHKLESQSCSSSKDFICESNTTEPIDDGSTTTSAVNRGVNISSTTTTASTSTAILSTTLPTSATVSATKTPQVVESTTLTPPFARTRVTDLESEKLFTTIKTKGIDSESSEISTTAKIKETDSESHKLSTTVETTETYSGLLDAFILTKEPDKSILNTTLRLTTLSEKTFTFQAATSTSLQRTATTAPPPSSAKQNTPKRNTDTSTNQTSTEKLNITNIIDSGTMTTNVPPISTSSFPDSLGSSPLKLCPCRCGSRLTRPANATQRLQILSQKIHDIEKSLHVDKRGLSATIRKKICARDDRPTARRIGFLSIILLTAAAVLIFLGDFNYICQVVHPCRNRGNGATSKWRIIARFLDWPLGKTAPHVITH